MRRFLFVFAALLLAVAPASADDVVTRLPTSDKVVALTFDACESVTPATWDKAILDFLVEKQIPFTVFVTAKFARHNQDELKRISALPFVEIENHSLDHPQHLEVLDDARLRRQVVDADAELAAITGRHTRFFRFPAGNYDERSLKAVEAMGYKVVHWTFASGDPVRGLTPEHLAGSVVAQTKPGSILIFHVNGRGYSTGRALPDMVAALSAKGYRFARLDEMVK